MSGRDGSYKPMSNEGYLFHTVDDRRYVAMEPTFLCLCKSDVPTMHGPKLDLDDGQVVTIIPTDPKDPFTMDSIEDWLEDIKRWDDVIHPDFARSLLFCGKSEGSIVLSRDLERLLSSRKIHYLIVEHHHAAHAPGQMKSWASHAHGGPHLVRGSCVRPLYRLFDDISGSLMTAFRAQDGEELIPLKLSSVTPQTLDVAVPARHLPQTTRPLDNGIHGKRVLLKDVYELKGLRVSGCNKAYYSVSKPATRNAPSIQRLIESGARILGTAKLSSMLSREEPTEAVDYTAPFNPRGDGYQSPAGSSSGSAAAIATYDWLDFAIGTDSTGSGRRPCMANGCFGIRMSTGLVPADGMMPCFPMSDTHSVFSRSIVGMRDFVGQWSGRARGDQRPPRFTSIIYPLDFFEDETSEQSVILDRFLADLSKFCNAPVKKVRIEQRWEEDPPPEAKKQSLHEYLRDVGRDTFLYDFFHCTQNFRETYERERHAKPFVNHVTGWRWRVAQDVTANQHERARQRLEVYKGWLQHTLLDAHGDNPVVVLRVAKAVPVYRHVTPGPPSVQEAWDELWLSPVLGAPELTIPIGETSYESIVSERSEPLPVVASLMGKPGSDLRLIETADYVLRQSGRPLSVATGRSMFPEHRS